MEMHEKALRIAQRRVTSVRSYVINGGPRLKMSGVAKLEKPATERLQGIEL